MAITTQNDFIVIDVLRQLPKFTWHRGLQKYVQDAGGVQPDLFPSVKTVVSLPAARYTAVLERVKRISRVRWWSEALDDSLAPRGGTADPPLLANEITLYPVECAIGSKEVMTLIGILICAQKENCENDDTAGTAAGTENMPADNGEGGERSTSWWIHDLSQKLPLRITAQTQFSEDYFCVGLVVLATGKMDAARREFDVYTFNLPPREAGDDLIFPRAMVTPRYIDPAPHTTGTKLIWDTNQQLLNANAPLGRTILFFSEVHLDVPAVRHALQRELTAIDATVARHYRPPPAALRHQRRHTRLTSDSNSFTQDDVFDATCTTPVSYVGTGINSTNSIASGELQSSTAWCEMGPQDSSALQLPVAVVLMGNFNSKCSVNFNFALAREYALNFGLLTDMLIDVPNLLRHCHIIIVPGPGDPGPAIFPKPPLLPVFTNNLTAALQNIEAHVKITLASSPCHVQCHSQRLVIARHDLLSALQHGSTALHIPTQEKYNPTRNELATLLPRLLLSQSHMLPCGAAALKSRVTADFDFANRLDPLPDLVCVADHCSAYSSTLPECPDTLVFNPGTIAVEGAIYDISSRSITLMRTK